jgi:hypothetical protein
MVIFRGHFALSNCILPSQIGNYLTELCPINGHGIEWAVTECFNFAYFRMFSQFWLNRRIQKHKLTPKNFALAQKPWILRISMVVAAGGWRTMEASMEESGSVSADDDVPNEFSPESLTSSTKFPPFGHKFLLCFCLPKFQSIFCTQQSTNKQRIYFWSKMIQFSRIFVCSIGRGNDGELFVVDIYVNVPALGKGEIRDR